MITLHAVDLATNPPFLFLFLYHPAFFWMWFEYSDCFADASPADLRQTLPGSFFSAAVRARVHERPRLSLSIVQLLVKREIIQSPEELTSFNNSIAFSFFFMLFQSTALLLERRGRRARELWTQWSLHSRTRSKQPVLFRDQRWLWLLRTQPQQRLSWR